MTDWTFTPASATQEWEWIATTVLATTAASISFTGISTDYKKFRILMYHVQNGTSGKVLLTLNNDTGTNYAHQVLRASSTSVVAARSTGQTAYDVGDDANANQLALLVISIAKPAAGVPARMEAHASTFDSSVISLRPTVAEWSNTADLISRIDLTPSGGLFTTGTRATLGGARDSL